MANLFSRHRWKVTLLLIILGLGILVGVFGKLRVSERLYQPGQTEAQFYSDLQERWLSGESCRPSCWEGITPGRTSDTEAVDLLNHNPLITNVNRFEIGVGRAEIDWNWAAINSGGGRIFHEVSDSKQIVYAILPGFGCCTVFRLGDIIQAFGEPSHVWVREVRGPHPPETPLPPYYSYNFIWISQGFAVDVNASGTQIDENFETWGPVLFVPTIEGCLAYEGRAGASLMAWSGYGDYTRYLVPIEIQ